MHKAPNKNENHASVNFRMLASLVAFTGLRDRDALDIALLRFLSQFVVGARRSTTLVHIFSVGQEKRCCVRARLDAAQDEPYCDGSWLQWNRMPELTQFTQRQKVVNQGKSFLASAEAGMHTAHFPVVGSRGVWAIVELESEKPFSASNVNLILAAVSIYQNVMGLLDYGEKDALTELLNRKTFDGSFLKATAAQSGRGALHVPDRRVVGQAQGAYWLAMLDIDHFKRVNDNFGHLIGDEVLLLIARLMRANFRMHDQLYRFGGEEFVVLMQCEDEDQAHSALERLRVAVQNYVFPQVGAITVSIGFSALRDKDTPVGAFGRADKAVYYAKENGRNQVCSYQRLVLQGDIVEAPATEMDVDLF